jgi:hypothetical protein
MRIWRDIYARVELHRRRGTSFKTNCDECGQQRPHGLYQYFYEHDGGRRDVLTGVFCSVGCMRNYHNIRDR